MERAAVLLREGDEQGDDRIPCIRPPRDHEIAADLRVHAPLTAGVQRRVGAALFRHGREHRGVEDLDLGRQPGDDQRLVHLRHAVGGDLRAGVDEHLEPLAETRRVELLVRAGAIGLPEVEVEDGRQLCGCRERQQLTAVLKSEVRDREVQDLRRQVVAPQRASSRICGDSGEDVGRVRSSGMGRR